jgi:cytochrome c peroxidase
MRTHGVLKNHRYARLRARSSHSWRSWGVVVGAFSAVAVAAVVIGALEQPGQEIRLDDPLHGVIPLTYVAQTQPTVELGRRLFFDPGASHSRRTSCASCHLPEHGFSDPRARSRDDFGSTSRHSQSILNLTEGQSLHWDGEFPSLEALVAARTGATRVVGGGYRTTRSAGEQVLKLEPVADTLARTGLYDRAVREAFGSSTLTPERFSTAVAAYVRTLRSTTSPFDRFQRGETTALSAQAQRGFALFRGRAGCAACHSVEGQRPTFTDGRFHNTGLAQRQPERVPAPPKDGSEPALGPRDGRRAITKRAEDAHAFKTPSLRDVALRPTYMHDGSLPTLGAVVRYYAVECGTVKGPGLDPLLKPFAAGRPHDETERDVADLVAFLCSLTGETRAGLGADSWEGRAASMRLTLLDPKGEPFEGLVTLAPGGDILSSTGSGPALPVNVIPDATGTVALKPFSWTHVRVTLPGSSLAFAGELVPDTCSSGTLHLVPAKQAHRASFTSAQIVPNRASARGG